MSYGLSNQFGSRSPFFGLSFRTSIHEFMDLDSGYLPNTEIEILGLNLRLFPQNLQNSVALERLTFLRMRNLLAYDRFDPTYSWQLSLELQQPKDLQCGDCLVLETEPQFGLGQSFLDDTFFIYGLALLNLQVGEIRSTFGRIGPGLTTGGVLRLGTLLKTHLFAKYTSDLFQTRRPHHRLALHAQIALTPLQAFQLQLDAAVFRRFNPSRTLEEEFEAKFITYF